MRENQIDPAGVDVERLDATALRDLREGHGRAFEVPPRAPAPERRVPRRAHCLILGVGFLP